MKAAAAGFLPSSPQREDNHPSEIPEPVQIPDSGAPTGSLRSPCWSTDWSDQKAEPQGVPAQRCQGRFAI